MKDIGNMMKQVQEMQTKMADMQARLDEMNVTGQAGAGLVKVTLNGKNLMQSIEVDDSLMKPDEKEILEDLLMAAYNEARAKVDQLVADQMKDVTGGMALPPGFNIPGM
ncbi:MAG: YbaB/EbfC family nucleoid-associated protein [Anderseniella sp.]